MEVVAVWLFPFASRQHKLNFTACDGMPIITINEVLSQPHLKGERIFFAVFLRGKQLEYLLRHLTAATRKS
ncbi:MAG: hypothetical protein A3H27_01720 [Acidobacteria bacterium RIFCSPLOWO2_02_FULL_59_13]|nr:MAG: hypothetical protein A3H27_01720 [Acidobacteria bacterium RIFCSPLOWO2_02_FULL_59_13]